MEPVFRTLEIAAINHAGAAPTPDGAKNIDESELAERARRRADRR